ncbi:hypothetical protein GCM10009642_19090 [Nocardiopsis metallicus]|uniref:Uncharacterized protein n=1 Tax=Nocardiopsis metallicus TaxID=179819 RepID=A0A840WJV4_9ACTN|nr:hypothetical protein [Nocardiopsis metallicus]
MFGAELRLRRQQAGMSLEAPARNSNGTGGTGRSDPGAGGPVSNPAPCFRTARRATAVRPPIRLSAPEDTPRCLSHTTYSDNSTCTNKGCAL